MTNAAVLDAIAEASAEGPMRTYIFCPEEPFGQVNLNGRMLQFNNGRLVSTTRQATDGRGMSEEDIAWFVRAMAEDEANHQPPRYIVYPGELTSTARDVLAGMLVQRVTMSLMKRAAGADAATLADDITMTLSAMLATDDGLPDVRGFSSVLNTVGRVSPSLQAQMQSLATLSQNIATGTVEQLTRDQEVIQAGAAGISHDAPPIAVEEVAKPAWG